MLDNLTIAKLDPVTKELRRIADALEIIVKYEYGYTLTPTPAPGDDGSDVSYTTDEQRMKQELQDMVELRPQSDVVDTEEWPDTK